MSVPGGALLREGPDRAPMPGMLLRAPDRLPTAPLPLGLVGLGVSVAGCDRVDQLPVLERVPVPVEVIREITWGFDLSRADDELQRSEEHTSELQSRGHLVCRLLL